MPTNVELEAMCEQVFPPRYTKRLNGTEMDADVESRSKALALAMEVRDSTEREKLRGIVTKLEGYQTKASSVNTTPYANGWNDCIKDILGLVRADSLLSEAQK